MGLNKLLLPFCPSCLDYLQERPKHGLDWHFIHKSAWKYDTILQNCRLITLKQTSFPPLLLQVGDKEEEIECHLTWSTDTVHVAILTTQGYNQSGPPRHVIGLSSSLIDKDVSVGENPAMAQTFLNQFVKSNGNYPMTDFRTPSWVHSSKKQWWSQLTNYVLYHRWQIREIGAVWCYTSHLIRDGD